MILPEVGVFVVAFMEEKDGIRSTPLSVDRVGRRRRRTIAR